MGCNFQNKAFYTSMMFWGKFLKIKHLDKNKTSQEWLQQDNEEFLLTKILDIAQSKLISWCTHLYITWPCCTWTTSTLASSLRFSASREYPMSAKSTIRCSLSVVRCPSSRTRLHQVPFTTRCPIKTYLTWTKTYLFWSGGPGSK